MLQQAGCMGRMERDQGHRERDAALQTTAAGRAMGLYTRMTEAQLIHYACANWDQTPKGFALSDSLAGTWVKIREDGRSFIWTRTKPEWTELK